MIAELNKTPFGPSYLNAEFKKDREEDQNIGPKDLDPLTLYVGNLAQEVTKDQMVRTFPKCKRIDIGYAKKMKYTRYAFVAFKNVNDSIEAFRNTRSTELYSKSLIVRFRRLKGTVGLPGETKPQNPPKNKENSADSNQIDSKMNICGKSVGINVEGGNIEPNSLRRNNAEVITSRRVSLERNNSRRNSTENTLERNSLDNSLGRNSLRRNSANLERESTETHRNASTSSTASSSRNPLRDRLGTFEDINSDEEEIDYKPSIARSRNKGEEWLHGNLLTSDTPKDFNAIPIKVEEGEDPDLRMQVEYNTLNNYGQFANHRPKVKQEKMDEVVSGNNKGNDRGSWYQEPDMSLVKTEPGLDKVTIKEEPEFYEHSDGELDDDDYDNMLEMSVG